MQYNTATRGLFRDLRRHLDRAWARYAGADPFAGDVWQVALLDLHVNASRRWPATQGVIDFGVIELAWLREIVKDWARTTRPYLQRLRETLRACQAASARPDRRRAHRPGRPGRRRLHPHPRRDQHAAASRRQPCTRRPPQPDDLPVLPGHRARPGQRADGRGARPVPPRDPAPGPRRPQRGRAGQGPARAW